ncbi:chalcone isomerase family protein [Vibrio sp. SCSIO 43136]|nr:chalcone isomerase family protein [Vibrio sp. SCSIO 43136]
MLATLAVTLLIVQCVQASTPTSQDNQNWNGWPTVGTSVLSWLFFDIYQSELKTPDGFYQESSDVTPHPMALSIHYLRDIPKDKLLEATHDQWIHLGYGQKQADEWIGKLEVIYPDIQQGDSLVYVTDGKAGQFIYYSDKAQPQVVGNINSETLNDAFLSIWLSPDTEYPKHRAQLLGQSR